MYFVSFDCKGAKTDCVSYGDGVASRFANDFVFFPLPTFSPCPRESLLRRTSSLRLAKISCTRWLFPEQSNCSVFNVMLSACRTTAVLSYAASGLQNLYPTTAFDYDCDFTLICPAMAERTRRRRSPKRRGGERLATFFGLRLPPLRRQRVRPIRRTWSRSDFSYHR